MERVESSDGQMAADAIKFPKAKKRRGTSDKTRDVVALPNRPIPHGSNSVLMHPPRRWNLTAYFAGEDYLNLPTVDSDPIFSKFDIPPGVYTTFDSLLKKSERRSVISADLSETLPPQTGLSSQLTGQTSASHFNDQIIYAPQPRRSLPGGQDPEYPVLPKADNQDNPTSPLPRSPEDQRALSMFKLQL
ncbi:hypothetical protein RHS01_09570 [Rhizoctonia solani]|uniref:Uncharacterized protein n=1 Tax=Rhizoctonia solani TaxID=456999 RepID=A0A8H7M0U0_9AGAM|nr:hypothetical protein RHS01_09570 [Rhizoctonia solani]